MTNKITGTIVNMSKATSTADTYIEVGFTSDAGSLAAGGFIEIQTEFLEVIGVIMTNPTISLINQQVPMWYGIRWQLI